MKKKSNQKIKITYKRVNVDTADTRRRVEAAFDILFDSVFEGILPLEVEAPLSNISTNPKEISSWRIRR